MASKLCDYCKSATTTLYCYPDSTFLYSPCNSKAHATNKLASPHPRVSQGEQALAHVICKVDAASLCLDCNRDMHFANPLASRHTRLPITPFYHPNATIKSPMNFLNGPYFFLDVDRWWNQWGWRQAMPMGGTGYRVKG